MPTTPLTASRYPASTAVPNVNQDIQNGIIDLEDNTIPSYTTTTTRDNAYAAWVALGNSMRDGLVCVVNGVPYRRMGGNWRINRPRNFARAASLTGGTGTIISGGATETGVTSGASLTGGTGNSFTLYETTTVKVDAAFRANGTGGAATCTVKINGAIVGNAAVSRSDITVPVTGVVTLAPGTYTVALRVDASGATVTWVDGTLTMSEGTVE